MLHGYIVPDDCCIFQDLQVDESTGESLSLALGMELAAEPSAAAVIDRLEALTSSKALPSPQEAETVHNSTSDVPLRLSGTIAASRTAAAAPAPSLWRHDTPITDAADRVSDDDDISRPVTSRSSACHKRKASKGDSGELCELVQSLDDLWIAGSHMTCYLGCDPREIPWLDPEPDCGIDTINFLEELLGSM